jgi:hypothetical protein
MMDTRNLRLHCAPPPGGLASPRPPKSTTEPRGNTHFSLLSPLSPSSVIIVSRTRKSSKHHTITIRSATTSAPILFVAGFFVAILFVLFLFYLFYFVVDLQLIFFQLPRSHSPSSRDPKVLCEHLFKKPKLY